MQAISTITTFLHTRRDRAGNVYWGFRFTRCSDGATCAGQISGGESNIAAALHYGPDGWRNDYATNREQISEKELFKLPYAGCEPAAIRQWVEANLKAP